MQNGNGGDEFDAVVHNIKDAFNKFKARQGGRGGGGGGGRGGSDGEGENPIKGILTIILVALLAISAWKAAYKVEPDEEGVVTRFGAFNKITSPGLHFLIPWVDEVYKIQSKRLQEQEFGYRKATRIRTKGTLTDESQMLTGDLNLADVEWMVQYRISDPQKYLFNARDVIKNIRDVSMSTMRRVVGDQLVGEVLTSGRARIASEVKDLMQQTLDEYDLGLTIALVELQSVDPPDSVKPAFNDVTAAKQEQEQDINNAEKEYNRIIPRAKGRADEQIANAKAYAIDIVNRAKGDAEYFSTIAAAYKKAPKITRRRLYLDAMEEIFSGVDSFTVVDDEVRGLLPVFGQSAGLLKPAATSKQ